MIGGHVRHLMSARFWVSLLAAATSAGAFAQTSHPLAPSINVSSRVVSDGVSGFNPKAVPTSILEYEIVVENLFVPPGLDDKVVIANPIPERLSLYVGDLGSSGSGPFSYEVGNLGSSFECSFLSLSNMSDCVEFSSDGGASFGYQPVPDQHGFDSAVTHLRFRLQPRLLPQPLLLSNFVLRYRMRME